MAYYDEKGFSKMQLDALERMRDMQKRSKSLVFEPPKHAPQNDSQPTRQPHPLPANNRNGAKPLNCTSTNPLGALLGNNIDTEKLLILILLFILYKNNADIKLILALGYLLI